MIYSGLAKKEIMENKWKYIVMMIWLVAFGSTLYLGYQWFGNLVKNAVGLDAEIITRYMGDMIDDFGFYAWANWYGKTFYQSLTVFAILLGISNIANEVNKGTAGFLFTRPMSRNGIYFTKYITGTIGLALLIIASTLITIIISQFYGEPLTLKFLAGIPMVFAGSLVVYSIAVFFSAIYDDQIKAAVAASLVAIVISIPGWFKSISYLSIYVHMRGWAVYFGEGGWIFPLAAMLLVSAAIFSLGQRVVNKKDF